MVFIFSVIVIIMIDIKKDMIDIIQYLGVFAVASFRIVPGTTKILNSFQSIKYQEPSIEILIKELDSKNNSFLEKGNSLKDLALPMEFQKEIKLKNLSFSYPARKEFSLSKLSMTIKKVDYVGIIGETGSGKSTLINLLIGLLRPNEGQVEVDGLNINSKLSGRNQVIT